MQLVTIQIHTDVLMKLEEAAILAGHSSVESYIAELAVESLAKDEHAARPLDGYLTPGFGLTTSQEPAPGPDISV